MSANETQKPVSEYAAQKKQAFEAGNAFRIATEASNSTRYFYNAKLSVIQSSDASVMYTVIEITGYSAKLRVDILGQVVAVYVRFTDFIFEKKEVSNG